MRVGRYPNYQLRHNGNGVVEQLCVSGQWVDAGVCVDDDVCVNGSEQGSCGVSGNGSYECVDGQWSTDCNNMFITVWSTEYGTDKREIFLPLVENGEYDFTVDWGDGTSKRITSWDAPAKKHRYKKQGTYTVTIEGTIVGWQFSYTEDDDDHWGPGSLTLLKVSQWGPLELGDTYGQFADARYLQITAEDAPGLSYTTSLSHMFDGCQSLTHVPGLASWDMSGIINMKGMFFHAHAFNQDIGSWDTSNVTNMRGMFEEAWAFNQDIGSWDTSSVTDTSDMFYRAYAFNYDIGAWDISSVVNMGGMFFGTEAFDQDISGWDTANVVDMSAMFYWSNAFNQDIGRWDTSNVTDMRYMFAGTGAFDQAIGGWDTSSVTTMEHMFGQSEVFNQDIGDWDTSNVTTMQGMFYYSAAFDQDIGRWTTSTVGNMRHMFTESVLSTANYDALLIGWATKPQRQNSLMGNPTYSAGAAAAARQKLIDDYLWNIEDGGQAP